MVGRGKNEYVKSCMKGVVGILVQSLHAPSKKILMTHTRQPRKKTTRVTAAAKADLIGSEIHFTQVLHVAMVMTSLNFQTLNHTEV